MREGELEGVAWGTYHRLYALTFIFFLNFFVYSFMHLIVSNKKGWVERGLSDVVSDTSVLGFSTLPRVGTRTLPRAGSVGMPEELSRYHPEFFFSLISPLDYHRPECENSRPCRYFAGHINSQPMLTGTSTVCSIIINKVYAL